MINESMKKTVLAATAIVLLSSGAQAQFSGDWAFECWDEQPNQFSSPYGIQATGNELMYINMGIVGTVRYGGPGPENRPPYCYTTAQTGNAQGRFGYGVGPLGSVQTNFDNNLVLTMGMPGAVVGGMGYATTTKNGARTLWGANAFTLVFGGASDRYFRVEGVNDGVLVQLRVDSVGDAIRMEWTMTNQDAEVANIGLWVGHMVAMLTNSPFTRDSTGAAQSHNFTAGGFFRPAKLGYTFRDGGRQIRIQSRFNRSLDPAGFPEYVDFLFGQSDAYGFRIENGPSPSTTPPNGQSDATQAEEIVVGEDTLLLGGVFGDNTFGDFILPDSFIQDTAYIQKFAEQPVAPGASRQIVHYVRSTWGQASYTRPYAVVLDAPRLLATSNTGQDGLAPNPFRLRVYVDNIRGFTTVDQEIPLNDVRVTLNLPAGLRLADGQSAVRVIPVVQPKEITFLDWDVIADGRTFGTLHYSVTVQPVPGPTKTVEGSINISATPRLNLAQGANLISVPWQFNDTSWSSILGLTPVTDFNAYTWNPAQLGYQISLSAERGKAAWIVSNLELGSHELRSNPRVFGDTSDGGLLIQLGSGWNLVGNPYPYPIQLGAIVGVSGANNEQSYTWDELVQLGFIAGEVAYWDEMTQSYKYIQGAGAIMEANRGYWMRVNTIQDFVLKWPPVLTPFLPGSNRAGEGFRQTADQWRLQLVARTTDGMDDQNFVGVVADPKEKTRLTAFNPPMAPTQRVDLAILETRDGQPTQLSGAYVEGMRRHQWEVEVTVREPGRVTVTWPNIGTVPTNVRFRLVDKATGEARDLRQASGYTFETDEPGVRRFTLQMEPGAAQRAVIGNVVVTRPSREGNAPFTINYALSTDATTSIRILTNTGREVYTVTRGRSDAAGQNTAVWTLRDNANRAVAPGTYRVEIIAESVGGERVRKVVPINVIR